METKVTKEQYDSLIDRIREVRKEHREIILIGIVGRNYDRVYESPISEDAGSLSVAEYFSTLVNDLLDRSEYELAITYACDKIFVEGANPDYIGSLIWDYFHVNYNTSLDWYYEDLATTEIDEYLNQIK